MKKVFQFLSFCTFLFAANTILSMENSKHSSEEKQELCEMSDRGVSGGKRKDADEKFGHTLKRTRVHKEAKESASKFLPKPVDDMSQEEVLSELGDLNLDQMQKLLKEKREQKCVCNPRLRTKKNYGALKNFYSVNALERKQAKDHVQHAFLRNDKKGDLFKRDDQGNSLLHKAVREGNYALAQLCIFGGLAIDVCNHQGETPLDIYEADFADSEEKDIPAEVKKVYSFLKKHVDFLQAVASGKLKKVKDFLKSPDLFVNIKDVKGNTPLHYAACSGKNTLVRLLIERGAYLCIQDNGGNTPLHHAALFKSFEIVQTLVAARADANIQNKTGNSPLHYAADAGSQEIYDLLRQTGANQGIKNNIGKTPAQILHENNEEDDEESQE